LPPPPAKVFESFHGLPESFITGHVGSATRSHELILEPKLEVSFIRLAPSFQHLGKLTVQ
jgi:hypothetical protein